MSALHHGYCTFAVHHEKSLVLAFFKVSIDDLFDNIESEKIIYCFGKSLEKVLNFGSKNLYLKARKLHIKKLHTVGRKFLCCYIPATMFRCAKEYAKNMMAPFSAWYIMENSLTEATAIWVLIWYWKKCSLDKKYILIFSKKLILWLCVLLKQPVTNGIPWERRNFKTQSFGFEKGMWIN